MLVCDPGHVKNMPGGHQAARGEHLLYVHKWRAYRVGLADGAVTSVPVTVDERPGEGGSPRAAW
jgi:hypothetical protein